MEESEYDIEALNRSLSPPPRIQPFPENWPIIEPPFRDQRPPYVQEAEEWEPVESSPIADDERMVLTDEMQRRVREVVLRHERLQKLLADRRYFPIGATLRTSKDPDAGSVLLFVLYDYDENQTIEVAMDRDSLEVTDVTTASYQPAPVQEELDHAIDLARQDEKLAGRLTDDLVGMALLVTIDDPEDPLYNHRLFDVRFGRPDERLPRYEALVDLSTETVVHSGVVAGLRGGNAHE
ncbi:MAG TPA: hypothetical protein VF177_08100 [Anaerolineae bacterium]